MSKLLRKKDLVNAIGVAKSTVADWIEEFNAYIPTIRHEAITYYRPEAITVLNAIKELRNSGYGKAHIFEMLPQQGFKAATEQAAQRGSHEHRGQEGRLNTRIDLCEKSLNEQDLRILELETAVKELKRQLLVTNGELSLVIEKRKVNKSLWSRLFKSAYRQPYDTY